MTNKCDEAIRATAARQHGVVTRRQLLDAGVSASGVNRRLHAGRLQRVHRGVYLVGPVEPPHARAMAAVIACGPTAKLSHLSAAILWELWQPARRNRRTRTAADPTRGATRYPDPIDVTVYGVHRRRPGIRIHRVSRLDQDETTHHHGIPVTTPVRTLVDLAGVLGSRTLERVVSRAERERLVKPDALRALATRHAKRPGIATLRSILDAPGGSQLTRSEAEARFLALVRKARLPPPRTNVQMGPYEIDFLWRAQGIAVEVDGYRYHSSRPRFEGDRRKDAWLLAQGIKVIRLSWRQIVDEEVATAVQVGQVLSRTGG